MVNIQNINVIIIEFIKKECDQAVSSCQGTRKVMF